MYQLHLDMFQAVALASLVLLVGRFLVLNLAILRKYCIPEPVVGGVVFAVIHVILRSAGIMEISFDSTLQTFFMTVFFCSVGFTACFRLLKKGGTQVLLFLFLTIIIICLQNLTGAGLASLFQLDPRLGLATGSIPMVGGHGTSAAFGPLLEKAGVASASTVALASATFGLVAGCVIGGPIAYHHITKNNLRSTETVEDTENNTSDKKHSLHVINSKLFLNSALFLAIAIGLGTIISSLLQKITIAGQPMSFPSYIGAMIAAAAIRNIADSRHKELPMEEIGTLGSISLSLFLGLAMIDLKLWQLAELALPMIVMLSGQVLLMACYAYFVVFRILGKNYDAAVMTTGFCGFAMGATPNAMANMNAVTEKYGPAPTAFFVVPLVGSLFVDFVNSISILLFMNIL